MHNSLVLSVVDIWKCNNMQFNSTTDQYISSYGAHTHDNLVLDAIFIYKQQVDRKSYATETEYSSHMTCSQKLHKIKWMSCVYVYNET